MDKRRTSVLIVDDFPLFRKAASEALQQSGDFVIAGETSDENTTLSLIGLKPDIVLLDLDAQDFNAIHILREIKTRHPSCRVVILMNSVQNAPNLMQAVRLDASGYLLRSISIDEFVSQMRTVAKGGIAASEKITSALAELLRTGTIEQSESSDINEILTRRELDVLCAVASGLTNRQVAELLKITDGTVKVHVKHLLKKLQFRSRVEAAVWASEHGYRVPEEKLTKHGFTSPAKKPAARLRAFSENLPRS